MSAERVSVRERIAVCVGSHGVRAVVQVFDAWLREIRRADRAAGCQQLLLRAAVEIPDPKLRVLQQYDFVRPEGLLVIDALSPGTSVLFESWKVRTFVAD